FVRLAQHIGRAGLSGDVAPVPAVVGRALPLVADVGNIVLVGRQARAGGQGRAPDLRTAVACTEHRRDALDNAHRVAVGNRRLPCFSALPLHDALPIFFVRLAQHIGRAGLSGDVAPVPAVVGRALPLVADVGNIVLVGRQARAGG